MYHITDRDGVGDDDDEQDDEGSQSWPSRTTWGSIFSLGEKHPSLLATYWGVRQYNYWWGYTSAQIDLMLIDQPFVSYKKKDAKHSKKEMDELREAWEKKRAGRSYAGKKVSLNDFLTSGFNNEKAKD